MSEAVDLNEFLQWFVLFTSDQEKKEKYGNRIIEVISQCVDECLEEVN